MHQPTATPCALFLLLSIFLLSPSHQAFGLRNDGKKPKLDFGVPGFNNSFDYIIVGGGTTGLTVASRLAEDPSLKVAVIEAGGFYEDAGNTSVVPGYDSLFVGTDPADTNPLVDWGYVTVPQKVS